MAITKTGTQDVRITTDAEAANAIGPSIYSQLMPYGPLRTSVEPKSVFYDPFDAALDTAVRWSTPTTSGTLGVNGVTASNTNGVLTIAPGTVAAIYTNLGSVASLNAKIPAFLQISEAIKLETPTANAGTLNGYRFWGQATAQGAPTTSAPLVDGTGWEINTDGTLRAVVYAGGSRIYQSAALTFPTDNSWHRYIEIVRTDRVWWFIDSLEVPVASTQWNAPSVQTLPIRFLAINGAAATTNPTILCSGIAAADTGGNNTSISDATYGWMNAKVTSSSTANADTGMVVKPATPIATGAALTNLANAITNATALANNAARRGAMFYNDDAAAAVYLKFGATASATSFTIKIAAGGYYELPQPIYTGQIDVIATAATGTLRITELT